MIAPVKSEVDDICLYIINFEDLSNPTPFVEDSSANHRLSKCKYFLASSKVKKYVLLKVGCRIDWSGLKPLVAYLYYYTSTII